MHPKINEILAYTAKRIPPDGTDKKRNEKTRSFQDILKIRKKNNLVPVITEVKPSSPTRFIRAVTPADAADIAVQMEKAGAAAISVLTEPQFFKGSLENLKAVREAVKLPVLRKDFIIDKRQIYESESDLILLIAGILGERLNDFVEDSISCGLEPLVEVHNKKELDSALSTDTNIIGINNRDLDTLKVDITTTEALAPLISDRIIISESGISAPEDAVRMINAGADAILVGTSIMQGNIYDKTYELVHALKR
ncbi:MAG: indole-3-glycerol-phosphate synthase [Candidatus Methanoperedens sp.]|nr:indole-3-glycerol-phosphate synthase [Candidatus Methanoperedens sp.]MCZ7369275.1 indole-3-glycerol-phosphate synthase [Candidatus Methanoperedens sp.]